MLVEAESRSSLAVFAAPQASTTRSAENVFVSPSCSTTTPLTVEPPSAVSSFKAVAFVSSSTFGCSSAGRTPSTSASDLPWTTHGKPSQFAQRTQWLFGRFDSLSRIPQGAWKG